VEKAALCPEVLTRFRVAFESGSNTERFQAEEEKTVMFWSHNYGKDMAEDILAMFFFPPSFTLQHNYSQIELNKQRIMISGQIDFTKSFHERHFIGKTG